MKVEDIDAIKSGESDAIDKTVERLVKEFRKLHRSFDGDTVYFRGQLHKTHAKNEYYTVIAGFSKKLLYHWTMPSYMTDKGRVYLYHHPQKEIRTEIGPHFLKRYRERSIKNIHSLTQTLMVASWDCRELLPVYQTQEENGNYGQVLASITGLLIGDVEVEKGIFHARTFVSDDMLQPVQMKAKKRLNDFLYERCLNYSLDDAHQIELDEVWLPNVSSHAQSVYEKYYSSAEEYLDYIIENDCENVKLDFKYQKTDGRVVEKKDEIPEPVRKAAGEGKRIVYGSVIEKCFPLVHLYGVTKYEVGNRFEEIVLYCPYTGKAKKVNQDDESQMEKQAIIAELTSK